MSRTKLYLGRHGQSEYQLEGRMGGNSPLTQVGIKHSEKISTYLEGISLQEIYCSTLIRSRQTAEIIKKSHKEAELIQTEKLAELNAGDMDKISFHDFKHKHKQMYESIENNKFNWAFPNGESYATMTERFKPTLEEIMKKEGNFFIAGHQALNRAIIGHLLNLPQNQTPFLSIPNEALFAIDLQEPRNICHIIDGRSMDGYIITLEIKGPDV
jgi:broad specificity phosphatase PhoE